MEIYDGPVVCLKSCLNCVHSIENDNGVVCGKRSPVLRLITGYKIIKKPNMESCDDFEAIPFKTSKQCKHCLYFDSYYGKPACYNSTLLKLMVHGPRFVAPVDTCSGFTLDERFLPRKKWLEKQR